MIPRYMNPAMGKIFAPDAHFRYWLKVELAVCRIWQKHGLMTEEELQHILKHASYDYAEILENEKKVHHDVIAFLMSVRKSVGAKRAGYIHYGLTSSDVVDTALSLQIRDALAIIDKRLQCLLQILRTFSLKYKDQIMIGRTHGIHAELTTLGLKFAHFHEEFLRQKKRLDQATTNMRVGKMSGAVGSYTIIHPDFEVEVCRLLQLDVDPISTQVISRDRLGELFCALANMAGSLERLAQEIRLLQKTESREVEEPFLPGQRGSSAMPHKRNPVICERICGMARLVQSNQQVALRNMALWHERDISHSSNERVIVPDTLILIEYMLDKAAFVIENLHVYPEAIQNVLQTTRGLIFSQQVLLHLVEKGLEKEQAYQEVQRIAMRVWQNKDMHFREELAKSPNLQPFLQKQSLEKLFDPQNMIHNIDAIFQRLGLTK